MPGTLVKIVVFSTSATDGLTTIGAEVEDDPTIPIDAIIKNITRINHNII
jgi:hypothetical protein